MDEMLHRKWLVESPKFETVGDYGVWKNHKCFSIDFPLFLGCFGYL